MQKMIRTAQFLAIVVVIALFHSITAYGQVATLQNWTNLYHGTSAGPHNIEYTVTAGSNNNRILLVAIASARNGAGTLSVSLTYGGQALTAAAGDMSASAIQHTALYYLNEAGLDAATNSTLTISITGGTLRNNDVWAAVFDYIIQSAPLTGSQNYNSGAAQITSFSFPTALTINAYNQAVEVVGSYKPQYNQIPVITYATDWTMVQEQTYIYNTGLSGFSIKNGVANRSIPTSNTTDASLTTFNINALASMTALSLKYEIPPPPTVQASNVTFSGVTSSSMTINWTPGNGINHLVLVKEGSAVDDVPVNGTTYTASNLFGSGSQIGTGNYVVYNGTGNSVTINNLNASTTYHVAVFEFSGPPGLEYYLNTNPARGSQITDPESAVTDDYRSIVSGNWGAAGTWETYSGSGWIAATSAPNSSSKVVTIRTGHTVTVAEAVSADQVVVEAGGQLTVNAGINLTIDDGSDAVDLGVDGTLYNSGTITTTGALAFNYGSIYQHAGDGGNIPTAIWNANSSCLISGITGSSLSGFGQSFGNFTWNCPSQTSTVVMNNNVTVQGNFTLTSTGSGKLAIIDNSASKTLTVSGDYTQTGGTFDLNNDLPGTSIAYLNIAGDIMLTGGAITESSSGGRGVVTFNGNSVQMLTSGGTLSNSVDFKVESGSYLQLGTGPNPAIITGSRGTFTLSSGATLGITDRYGITSTTTGSTGGNIRVTGTRDFNSGATYIYNGSISQNTGNGLPSTVNSLVFNNTGGAVTFNSARIITNDFSITAGSKANLASYTHTTEALTLGGVGQPGGSYGGTGSGADNERPDYFEATTGIVTNGAVPGTWLGITTDWNSAANWIGGVPGSGINAKIYAHTLNQPVISGVETALCNTLTINSGASLTIDPSGKATFGSLVNNGILNLNSNSGGIASLILDSYSGSGTSNIQLYLTGGGDASNYPWHYISSPVTSLSVTDVLSSGNDPDANDLSAYYEDLVTDNKDKAWYGYDGWNYQSETGIPSGPTFVSLEAGRGYLYYSYYNATRSFGGNLNTGDLTKSLSYTGATEGLEVKGWNLLGNPFSACLNWDAITLPSGVDNAIYFTWNNSIVSYVNGQGSTAGVTGFIPPMQGFFVKANSSGKSLTLGTSARVHNAQSRYKGEQDILPLIRLKIESESYSDETLIRLDEKARNEFDSNLDAYKFGKTRAGLSLWTTLGQVSYSINSIPYPETISEVPVGLNVSQAGNFKLKISQSEGIDKYNIYLTDRSTGITINLRTTPSLNFASNEGIITDRFILKIVDIMASAEDPSELLTEFNIYSSFDQVNIQPLTDRWDGRRGSVELVDITGRTISTQNNVEFWKNSLIQVPVANRSGLVFVKMKSDLLNYVGRVMVK